MFIQFNLAIQSIKIVYFSNYIISTNFCIDLEKQCSQGHSQAFLSRIQNMPYTFRQDSYSKPLQLGIPTATTQYCSSDLWKHHRSLCWGLGRYGLLDPLASCAPEWSSKPFTVTVVWYLSMFKYNYIYIYIYQNF